MKVADIDGAGQAPGLNPFNKGKENRVWLDILKEGSGPVVALHGIGGAFVGFGVGPKDTKIFIEGIGAVIGFYAGKNVIGIANAF